jgi:hypothetical protein
VPPAHGFSDDAQNQARIVGVRVVVLTANQVSAGNVQAQPCRGAS